jgi:hypothetical protein
MAVRAGAAQSPGQAANQNNAVTKVTELLNSIKTEVAADLATDTTLNTEMVSWCDTTVTAKQNAIADASQRETDLATEIETSAAEKAKLKVEIAQLEKDLAKDSKALAQAQALRQESMAAFHETEKEMLGSITALKNALTVLEKHYTPQEPEDLDGQRAKLEEEKTALGADGLAAGSSLMSVAAQVKTALRALPGGEEALEARGMMNGEDGAQLQAFLAKPEDSQWFASKNVEGGSKKMGLISAGRQLSRDGNQIFGILKQLLETFQSDLDGARSKETTEAQDFKDLESSKVEQIDTYTSSSFSKQDQLAYYTTVNAQAHEDLKFNTASRLADTAFLQDVQAQCRDSAHEFKIRKANRETELSAIDQAIGILTAGAGVSAAGSAAPVSFGIHRSAGAGHVFLRSQKHNQTQNSSRGNSSNRSTDVKSKPWKAFNMSPNDVVNMYLHHSGHDPKKHGAAAHLTPKVKPESKLHALARAAAALHAMRQEKTVTPHSSSGTSFSMTKLTELAHPSASHTSGKALAALSTSARAVLASYRIGPMTSDAIDTVVKKVDELRATLKDDLLLEVQMRDTCVAEDNAAKEQLERRKTDQAQLDTSIASIEMTISNTEAEVHETKQQILDINASLAQERTERYQEHNEFRASIIEQEAHQEMLHKASQALKNFYGGGPKAAASSQGGAASFIQIDEQAAAEPQADALPERSSNRVSRDAGAAKPKGFTKPAQKHAASMGILGILQLLVDESEALVEAILVQETASLDALTLSVQNTRTSMDQKDRQLIILNLKIGEEEAKLLEEKTSLEGCKAEMTEIEEFRAAVKEKCNYVVTNFVASQEARQAEIEHLRQAKAALMGMASSPSTGAVALTQLAGQA